MHACANRFKKKTYPVFLFSCHNNTKLKVLGIFLSFSLILHFFGSAFVGSNSSIWSFTLCLGHRKVHVHS